MTRINRIGVKQTAKVIAVFYFVISLVFVLPVTLITLLAGSAGKNSGPFPAAFGGVFMLLLPIVYGVLGFIIAALVAFIYNQIAKRVGGIEIDLSDENKKASEE